MDSDEYNGKMSMIKRGPREKIEQDLFDDDKNKSSFLVLVIIMLMSIPVYYGVW